MAQAYDDWCDAVDRAFKSQGMGITVRQLSPFDMQAAFAAGTSPVVYARQAQVQPPLSPPLGNFAAAGVVVPAPSSKMVLWTYRFLAIAGSMCWVVSGAILCLWLLLVLGVFAGAKAEDKLSVTTVVAVMGGYLAIVNAFVMALAGAVWHWMAQLLLMHWEKRTTP